MATTGEIMSLRPVERNRVTQLVAETVKASGRAVKTISGVSVEGSLEGIDHALAAKETGADAILLMPPHHWLRFGRSSQTAVGFFEDVASAGIDIVVHQYPAWTKAGYTLDEMKALVQIPRVKCIKMGTRDMSRWLYDYQELKKVNADVPIITCHDEFLLPSLAGGGRWGAGRLCRFCARADRRAGAAGVGRGFGRGERGAEKGRAAQPHRLCFWRAVVERASAHEVRPLAAGQVPLAQDAAALAGTWHRRRSRAFGRGWKRLATSACANKRAGLSWKFPS